MSDAGPEALVGLLAEESRLKVVAAVVQSGRGGVRRPATVSTGVPAVRSSPTEREVRAWRDRVVLGRKGTSSMVKIRWTEAAPEALNDADDAEELGAVWEGEELVTYDIESFRDLFTYYEDNEYQSDND